MRVLHVHSGNIYGGIERALEALAVASRVMEMELAVSFDARLADGWRAAGLPVHVFGRARLSDPLAMCRARRAFAGLVRQRRPDAIVCHSSWTRAILGRRLKVPGIPLLLWQHTADVGHWLDRLASRTPPDFVIYNSAFTHSVTQSAFNGIPGAVLHYPVLPPPADAASARSALRASLATPDDAVVVLQASRLEPRKGHEELLAALGELRDEPRWIAWVAGTADSAAGGGHGAKLAVIARKAGIERRVRWLGERRDVPSLLAAADLYCQPCVLPESFGIAFVEALYAGVPVVTSAFGGALEIVNGSCGILTVPGSRSSLTDALRLLIRDDRLRQRAAEGGPARARRLCEPSTQVDRLEQILRAVVARWTDDVIQPRSGEDTAT